MADNWTRHLVFEWLDVFLAIAVMILMLACTSCKMLPPPAQKGSSYSAAFSQTSAPIIKFRQGENQETASKQTYERVTEGNRVTERLETELGTTQRDKARDDWASVAAIEARIRSYGSIKAMGGFLIVCALAMFWPPIRAFTGTTVQIATAAAGFAMIFGSQIMAGNETLFLMLSIFGIAGIYLFRRHGYLQGMIDANN